MDGRQVCSPSLRELRMMRVVMKIRERCFVEALLHFLLLICSEIEVMLNRMPLLIKARPEIDQHIDTALDLFVHSERFALSYEVFTRSTTMLPFNAPKEAGMSRFECQDSEMASLHTQLRD